MQEFFKSEISNDEILIIQIKKSHKSIFRIKMIDDATEHLKLITNLSEKLKKNDIKWVEIELSFSPTIPPNTISYINKYNNNFICHIEDFERFYLSNVTKIIQPVHIYCSHSRVTVDGWTKVSGYKKEKKDKYTEIIKELQTLVGDWNNM
jgi:hypothetical protein